MVLVFFVHEASTTTRRSAIADTTRPFRENVTLPVDSNLLKQFGTVEDLLTDQRWKEAIGILQEIGQTESKDLVQVQSGKSGGVANYLNVATRCNVLLSRISAEGRNAYRQKVDSQAKRWFENWERTRDQAELLKIVRQAYLSSYGDDALWALGELAWDQGEFSTAQAWWEQLIPLPENADPTKYPTVLRYPDSEIDRAEILARIVMCSIVANEPFRASDQLRQFSDRYPTAEGWLAGRHGRLVEILQQTLESSKNWTPNQRSAGVETFAYSPERNPHISETIDIGSVRWSHSLPSAALPRQFEGLPLSMEPLCFHPVVYKNFVFVNDASAIRAWNVLSGEAAWQSDGRDPAVIYPTVVDETPLDLDRPCVGVPHFTMTIAGDRLYARMGSPVTCSSSAELRRDFGSDLVCLDLTREGKLIWKINANDLLPDPVPWRFEGTPVVVAGHAYVVLCRRNPQLELTVACLDAFDGRLIWQRHVGAFRESVDENSNRISHLLLTAGSGRIFLSTDAGAIIALEAQDGRMAWAISYERRSDEQMNAPNDASQKNLLPALFHAGLLFVAPNDANAAYCIEADSGRVRWHFPYLQSIPRVFPDRERQKNEAAQLRAKQWRQLLGVAPGGLEGRLIVSGSSLWAIDIEKGITAWPRSEIPLGRIGNSPFGRGLIAGDQILIPLRESIEVFDLRTGEQTRNVLLKSPISAQQGGNLVFACDMLLVAQPNRLVAYCEYGRLKERIEKELIQRPNDTGLRIQLAELESVNGTVDAAIADLQAVLNRIKSDDPAFFSVRRKLMTLLRDTGVARFRDAKLVEARDYLSKAVPVADDIIKKVDLIFDLARIEDALAHPEAAIAQFQQILNRPGLASVRRDSQTAGFAASHEISRLIDQHGRETYREIEMAANSEFEELQKSKDSSAIQRLVEKYPNSEIAVPARKMLVRLYRESKETPEAYAVLNEIREMTAGSRDAADAVMTTIDLLHHAGYSNSEMSLWQSLATRNEHVEVESDGKKLSIENLARKQLERFDAEPRAQVSFLESSWIHALQNDSHVIIPDGKPPSSELSLVIVCSKHPSQAHEWVWRFFDQRTGQLRWEETASNPISVASWTPVHLLVGTTHGWFALMAGTDRHVWDQISIAETKPILVKFDADGTVWPAFFDANRGLQLFHPDTGRNVAILKPPGQLHSVVAAGYPPENGRVNGVADDIECKQALKVPAQSIRLFMQTIKPTRIWSAFAATHHSQWSIQEVTKDAETWHGTPIVLQNRLIGMTTDHCLAGHSLDDQTSETDFRQEIITNDSQHSQKWIYNNFAFGSADPVAFECHGALRVLIDGSQLGSFDPETGAKKWTTGLANLPLVDAIQQVCVGEGRVFATSQGILRSVSIQDGKVDIARYLGDSTPQWRTQVAWRVRPELCAPHDVTAGSALDGTKLLIAAWPIDPTNTNRQTIYLCDGNTGAIVQRIRVDATPRILKLNHDGFGVLWTEKSLSGLRFYSAPIVAKATDVPNGTVPKRQITE